MTEKYCKYANNYVVEDEFSTIGCKQGQCLLCEHFNTYINNSISYHEYEIQKLKGLKKDMKLITKLKEKDDK